MPTTRTTDTLAGSRGTIATVDWPLEDPRRVVVLAHGYGEHIGRYEHVAQDLLAHGAAVYGLDHLGHGESDGERALVEDFGDLLADLDLVVERARAAHPDVPLVLMGHSMGGLIATRYAQTSGHKLDALVISAPVIGGNPDIEALLTMDPIPEVPIPPEALSRDPEVGRAYAEDPLVYHGPFKRATLEAMFSAVRDVADGQSLGPLPTLWIHGELDGLAPLAGTREAIARLRGETFEEHVYPGAMHEVLNETNKDEVLGDVEAFLDGLTR
jgi:alpha-beta hydrolase superfamily lysophospholipase